MKRRYTRYGYGYGPTRTRSRSRSLDRQYREPEEPIKSFNMRRRCSRYEDVRILDRQNRDAEEHWPRQQDRISVSEQFESDRYGRTSDSALTREYMDRSYYHDEDKDRVRLLRPSHLSEDIPCSEPSPMKFQRSNQPEDNMNARYLYRSSGLEQSIGCGSDAYRTSPEKSYGGSEFPKSSTRPRTGLVLLDGNFLSPLPSLDLGFRKNKEFFRGFRKNKEFFRDRERAHLGIGSPRSSYNNQYKSPMSSTDDFGSLQSEGLPLNPRSEDKMVTEAVGHHGHGQKLFYQYSGVSETSLSGLSGERRPTALLSQMEVLGEGFNYSQVPRSGNDNMNSLPTEAIIGYGEHDLKNSLGHFGHSQNTLNGMFSPRMATTRSSPIQNMDERFKNPQMLRSGNADMGGSVSFDYVLRNVETVVPENYRYQGFLKSNSVDPIVDRGQVSGSHFENFKEQTFPSNDNLTTVSYLRGLEQKLLSTRSSLVEYETVEPKGPEPLRFGRDVSLEGDAGASSYLPYLDRLARTKHGRLHETDGGLSSVADSRITEPMEKGKQGLIISHSHLFSNNDDYNESQSLRFSSGDEQRTEKRISQDLSLREEDQFNAAGHFSEACFVKLVPSHRLPATMRLGERSNKHVKSARRDLKKRLGPIPQSPLSKPSSKKLKSDININSWEISCVSRTHHSQERDLPNVKVKREITEPPEDSNEFKQRARNAFFKFVKSLNENPTVKRKYLEQRGNITLRCNVCGRHSKEFIDTLSLLQHAFNSRFPGSRAEHLGFHNALCVLMGWSSDAGPRNLWVRKILSKTEGLALKEDLIIWPPVVIIHNSSITKGNHEERVIISIQKLEAHLKCMGFDKEKTKVQRGESENQNIMIASFNATLSGLKEAESLHKLYADKKHGRVEFQQIISGGHNNTNKEMEKVSADEVVNVLYGYLGISEDLDKLDSEHGKRRVVKSKKEIQAIADATL